jgi:hypothetical protein
MAHFGVLRDTQDTPVRRRIYEKVRHVVTLLARIYNMFEPRLTSNQQIKEFIRNDTQDMAYLLHYLKKLVIRYNTASIVVSHLWISGLEF